MNQNLTMDNTESLEQIAIKNEDLDLLYDIVNFLGVGPDYFRRKYGENSIAYELSQVIAIDCLTLSREAEQTLIDHPEEIKLRYIKYIDYYVPRTKEELEDWLRGYHRKKGIPLPKGFRNRNKQALYAMYFGIRDTGG